VTECLEKQYSHQQFPNGYQLVDGVAMHEANGSSFVIPPAVLKRHLTPGQFVEVRINSNRFSAHEADAAECACPSCNGPMSRPVLSHSEPASLFPLPDQSVPSRGWGEDFWVKITKREGRWMEAQVDNRLVESRLHEIDMGDLILLEESHVLAIHPSHRLELVKSMDAGELKELAVWLGSTHG
jgi:hypothetical protein